MGRLSLGNLLLIANPASHSGAAAARIEQACRFFEDHADSVASFEVFRTTASGDAQARAALGQDVDTVVALGGDGIIHEVINGLMAIEPSARPRLGVVPLGSGNDFARTLGLKPNDADAALEVLLCGQESTYDVGLVTSDAQPEGTYFAQTLSFGLDAAIAIDTTKRRSQGDRQRGAGLFLTSGLKVFWQAGAGYPCVMRLDGGEDQSLETLVLAVQNGPTYGGGFRICPQAAPDDGLLGLCYNVSSPPLVWSLVLFGLARFGLHTHSRVLRFAQSRHVDLSFSQGDSPCPCQVDGEELTGTQFDIVAVPQALRVIAPRRSSESEPLVTSPNTTITCDAKATDR